MLDPDLILYLENESCTYEYTVLQDNFGQLTSTAKVNVDSTSALSMLHTIIKLELCIDHILLNLLKICQLMTLKYLCEL